MSNGVNIIELAKACGVSPSTVSRVFSGKAKVNPETRSKVLHAAQTLNYTPSLTASREHIALLVPSTQQIAPPSWFASALLTTMIREIYHAGYSPMLYDLEDPALTLPNSWRAAVAFGWRPQFKGEKVRMTAPAGTEKPLISINAPERHAYNVYSDHARGVEEALEYLWKRGHRKIGFFEVNIGGIFSGLRRDTFRNFMSARQIDPNPLINHNVNFDGKLVPEETMRILRTGATALLCLHEDWTAQLGYQLQLFGKEVPADISIITAEVPGLSEWMFPPHTTFVQDFPEITRTVLELIGRVSAPPGPGEQTDFPIPCKLIERSSVLEISTRQ